MNYSQRYQLGSWVICPQSNSISNQADTHVIDNKSMQVLVYLIQRPGEQLSKSQIYQHVWKGRFVTDDILSVTVSKIRKALGDNARSPTFIKTLPGVGYVLIADVKVIEPGAQTSAHPLAGRLSISHLFDDHRSIGHRAIDHRAKMTVGAIGVIGLIVIAVFSLYFSQSNHDSAATQLNIKSIAVLPFDDLSSEQNNQYFSDGLPDAIISKLSQIRSLKVISRYSTFTYRGQYSATEIGQALQVDALIDGSVQRMGQQVRINVSIFDTKNALQLWSETFDGNYQDIFTLQDQISRAIQKVIQPDPDNDGDHQTEQGKTHLISGHLISDQLISGQAYEWYLMGQYHWRQRNPNSLAKAVTYFEHSLALEPDYAEAHIGLSITYAYLHHYGNWSERKAVDKALPHIERALNIKPNSSRALAAKGMILTLKEYSEMGLFSADSATVQYAEQAFLQSLELQDNATTHRWYASLLHRLGKRDKVIHHMEHALKLNPLSGSLKRTYSGYLRNIGKPDSAQRIYQQAVILEPDHFSNLIGATHIFRLTQESIIALAQWQSANAELFSTCSSDEYCEQLVLAYLSIGANDAANAVLANMKSKHGHFLNSLDMIDLGLKGEEQKIVSFLQRQALRRPHNRRMGFDLAVAQFRAAQFKHANSTLLQLYPEWRDATSNRVENSTENRTENIAQSRADNITADNYAALLLYAATLLKLDETQVAESLLQALQTALKQGRENDNVLVKDNAFVKDHVFIKDSVQVEFALAQINAQLGNAPQALQHLNKSLDMGWLASFTQEWWILPNNHLLQPLHEEPEFKLLLTKHQERLTELKDEVARTLSQSP